MREKQDGDRSLQNEWVLWEHKAAGVGNKNPNQWKENMIEICSFSTVEEFWCNFNHIPKPSDVFFDGESRKRVGAEGKTVEEYSLFKKGIEPEWGDPNNVVGGEWFCRHFFESDVLDLLWQNLVMGVVGEGIEDAVDEEKAFGPDLINGCRVVDKSRGYPMFKLELWVKTRDPTIRNRIKDRLQEIMMDGQPATGRRVQLKMEWKDHSA